MERKTKVHWYPFSYQRLIEISFLVLTTYEHMLIIFLEAFFSMARPKQSRRVAFLPDRNYFKPRGISLSLLKEVILTVDEFEAIRLADLGHLYQQQAAKKMNVSRQTFGRIIESAHRKVAEALVKGKALRIEGGDFETAEMRKFRCLDCEHLWESPCGKGGPSRCPSCKSGNIQRAEEKNGAPRAKPVVPKKRPQGANIPYQRTNSSTGRTRGPLGSG